MKEYSLEDIQRLARSGPLLLLGRRLFAVGISFVGTITIARLLTPRDYGLAAMAFVMVSFMQVFRDFGLTNALLRTGSIDDDEVSFLFWFNAAATVAVSLLLIACAPFIAQIYAEPAMANIIAVSLIGFTIEGICLQHAALLKRDLRFPVIAAAETLGLTAGFLVGLVAALAWRNVWAIVVSNLTQSFMISAVTVYQAKWRPRRFSRPRELGDLMRFGVNSSIFSLLNFMSRNTSTFAIGYLLGPTPLGLFNRAFSLFQLPLNNLLQPITQATLPVMARLRTSPENYRDVYTGLVRVLCCALAPAGAILTTCGTPLVLCLLGEKWAEAGPILSVLSVSLIGYGLVWPCSDLLISQNRSAELRTSGVYDFLLRAGGTLIGAMFSPFWAAAGLSIGTLVTVPVRVWQAGRTGPVSTGAQWRAFLVCVPLCVGAFMGSIIGSLVTAEWTNRPLAELLAAGLSGGVMSLILGLCFGTSRKAVFELAMLLTGRRAVGTKHQVQNI